MKLFRDILLYLSYYNFFNFLDDKTFLKFKYRLAMRERLNLKNPQTFNEKLQWLKLYNRKDIYTTMVDKYEVKKYISGVIGKEYVIPSLGIYDKFEDINFDKLPNKFVIKCTHDSGGLVVVKNKKNFDIKNAKKKINSSLKRNYYYSGREWPYKNVKPRILIEKYMEDYSGELIDYKLYSFNGRCDYVMVCVDRLKGNTKFLYFDKNWNLMRDFSNDGLKYGDKIKIKKPKNLDEMFKFSSLLSKDMPFVRIDWYDVNGTLYFGEMTFFPSSGFDNTRTDAVMEYLNKMLVLDLGMNK